MNELWVIIPKWETFQHYKDRDPTWIKMYIRLLHDEGFRSLSGHERGVLLCIYLSYAASGKHLPHSTQELSARFGLSVTAAHLKALNDAGYIEVSSRKPLAPVYSSSSPEKEKEKEPPISPMGSASAAHGGQGSENNTNTLTGDAAKVSKLITNGVIQNDVDLAAELNGYGIKGDLAEVLRDQLARRREFA